MPVTHKGGDRDPYGPPNEAASELNVRKFHRSVNAATAAELLTIAPIVYWLGHQPFKLGKRGSTPPRSAKHAAQTRVTSHFSCKPVSGRLFLVFTMSAW